MEQRIGNKNLSPTVEYKSLMATVMNLDIYISLPVKLIIKGILKLNLLLEANAGSVGLWFHTYISPFSNVSFFAIGLKSEFVWS